MAPAVHGKDPVTVGDGNLRPEATAPAGLGRAHHKRKNNGTDFTRRCNPTCHGTGQTQNAQQSQNRREY